MSTLLTALMVVAAFHALGFGPALLLRSWTGLPWRFLTMLTLFSTATLSWVVFWIAFLLPAARLPLAGAAVCVSVALAVLALRRDGAGGPARRDAWMPAACTVLLLAVYLTPLLASAGPSVNVRLGHMPADNILPGLVAQRVVTGASTARPVPPLWPNGDRVSERPPLQAAIVVAVGSLVPGLGEHEYQILAAYCQAQWLPALWLLGACCGLSRRPLAFVLAACACSGFFFVNTIYTWPKLLAAALMLGGFAIALAPADGATSRARTIVAATACVLALLAHPGPAFTLLAVPLAWTVLRPLLRLRASASTLLAAGAIVAAGVAPWRLYVTTIDPPAGRLLREHLADGRAAGSAGHAIVEANLERPIGEHARIRLGNLASQLGDPLVALWPGDIAAAQRQQFFHHGAALGVLLIGLVSACRPPRPGTADDAMRRLAVVALAALALWSVTLFPAGAAVIHHGSPVTTALLFLTGAYGLTRLPVAAAVVALGIHAGVSFVVWFLPVWRGPWPPF